MFMLVSLYMDRELKYLSCIHGGLLGTTALPPSLVAGTLQGGSRWPALHLQSLVQPLQGESQPSSGQQCSCSNGFQLPYLSQPVLQAIYIGTQLNQLQPTGFFEGRVSYTMLVSTAAMLPLESEMAWLM